MSNIYIENRVIGDGAKPFIIAELSGNHNQSFDRALALIDAAVEARVDAVKLQTATPDGLTMKGVLKINDEESLWNGKDLYSLYKEACTPWEWHQPLFEYAKKKGVTIFSSPFEEAAVDFLEALGTPLYKIASFENTDHLLLKKVARTRKPVIMSTGVANIDDIQESIDVLRSYGSTQIVLLKCTSTYPASPENTNILTIPHMKELFGCPIGLSDHTMGIGVAVGAVCLGATVIEKHFTLRRSDGGVDSAFSLETEEMAALVTESERAWLALGKVTYDLSDKEKKSKQFKRSLYFCNDINRGEVINPSHLRSVRPANGLHTKHYDAIVGRVAKEDIKAGTPVSWEHFE